MSRSYLFPGSDTRSLTPAQYQLELLYDRIDTKGHRITPDIFFKSPEYGQWLSQKYGDLSSMVPPGSQITNSTPFAIEYKDAEGYTHKLTRSGADAANNGAISRQTDRPGVLPAKGQQSLQDMLQKRLEEYYGTNPTLADLDPQTRAALEAINANERSQIQTQQDTERGKLLAGLYGNQVNQSSVANEAAAEFAKRYGLISQQQAADAAAREIGARQYLTGLQQQRGSDLSGIYSNLAGLQNQRDIASSGIDLDYAQLAENARQFNVGNSLNQFLAQLQKRQVDDQTGALSKFLKISQGVGNILGAGSAGLAGYKAGT